MDALVGRCEHCGSPLPARRKLKDYCSYACRGRLKALRATEMPSGLKGSKNTKQNKVLQSLKRQSRAGFSFARINSCTYRLDRQDKSSAGCLMEASPSGARQKWIVRVGNQASEPLTLAKAKRTAAAILRERGKGEPRDWIAELNKIAGAEVERAALAEDRKKWPTDILGGARQGSIDSQTRR
jgi:hypothetical protein